MPIVIKGFNAIPIKIPLLNSGQEDISLNQSPYPAMMNYGGMRQAKQHRKQLLYPRNWEAYKELRGLQRAKQISLWRVMKTIKSSNV